MLSTPEPIHEHSTAPGRPAADGTGPREAADAAADVRQVLADAAVDTHVPTVGWVMRRRTTSPLSTRFVTR